MIRPKTFYFSVLISSIIFSASCFKPTEVSPSRTTSTPAQTTPTTDQNTPISDSPTTSKSSYEQAFKDYQAKNYDKAESGFKDVISENPKNADAHFYLGKIYVERKDYQTSLPYLQEAVKLNENPDKLMALGDSYFELKKYEVAIVQYLKVSNYEPNNANAYYKMGLTYVGLKNSIAASQQLRKLEPLNKDLADKLRKEIDKID
jgi:tetratricopeptide (TPR) repeat protein